MKTYFYAGRQLLQLSN